MTFAFTNSSGWCPTADAMPVDLSRYTAPSQRERIDTDVQSDTDNEQSQQGRMRHEILLDIFATYRCLRDTGKDDSAELQALIEIAKLHGIDEDDLDDHYMRTS